MNTPYQWTKQVASHFGGTRNGAIVHWPNGINGKDDVRSQFCHVIDIAPTVLEAARIPAPTVMNGIQQAPYEGAGMLYAFNDAKAAERRETQYFEMFCNRGIYHEGWTAVTRHGVPWLGSYKRAFDDDVWELYDTNKDWTQSHDLAKENPKKLVELQRLFLIEATKYSALPLDDRTFERFNADIAGRPQLVKGKSQILFGGMSRLSEGSLVVTHNKSYSLTAEIEVPKSGAHGVIVAIGGSYRRLESLRPERQTDALLQLLRHSEVLCRRQAADSRGQAPGAHGVQVRRRRRGQGRRSVALCGRQERRRGPRRYDGADAVLRRRDLRRREGNRFGGLSGLWSFRK
jgi:Sulfatase